MAAGECNMKTAIITGASSGFGKDFAKEIDRRFTGIEEIWLIARRTKRLEALGKELNKPCRLITADLCKNDDLLKITRLLEKHKPDVKILVNSAGFGKIGKVAELSLEDTRRMIKTNCLALTEMIYKVLPYMKKNSLIINIASSAAFMPQPVFAEYAASKSYVLSFTRALRYEVKNKAIKVTAVCPGPAKTEFFDIAEEGRNVLWYKKFIMTGSKKVVKKAINDALNNKELSIYGIPMKLFYVITKIVPHRCLIKIADVLNKGN